MTGHPMNVVEPLPAIRPLLGGHSLALFRVPVPQQLRQITDFVHVPQCACSNHSDSWSKGSI
jgi:hypothetical protein